MRVAHDILGLSRPLRAILLALLGLILLPYALTPLYAVMEPFSTVMLWRRLAGEPVARTYVPLSRISPNLQLAVIIAEDGRFCEHWGVDFQGIQAALDSADNIEDMRGGSTITQQVAKNLFLWNSRSYVRKALEFPLALWVDLILSKRRILEIYLNVAEWGPGGQFGVEAGAEYAFHKPARELSRYQAALLASVLPNPLDRSARRPGPGLRRLAGLYEARSGRSPEAAACIRKH
jgi:monofunctional biosynthetic peptidoglycan transglycosylase